MLSMKIVPHFQPSLRCCRLSYGVQQFCQHFLHKSAGFRLHVCPCTEHTRERSCTATDQILYGMGIGFTLQNVENGIGQLFSLLRFHAQDPLPQRGIQQLTGVGGILGIVPVTTSMDRAAKNLFVCCKLPDIPRHAPAACLLQKLVEQRYTLVPAIAETAAQQTDLSQSLVRHCCRLHESAENPPAASEQLHKLPDCRLWSVRPHRRWKIPVTKSPADTPPLLPVTAHRAEKTS